MAAELESIIGEDIKMNVIESGRKLRDALDDDETITEVR